MIEIKDSVPAEQWDEFVFNHPHGNIFQTMLMNDVYLQAKNYDPVSLAAIESDTGKILALMEATIISEYAGPLKSVTSRAVVQGGPLFISTDKGLDAVNMLLEKYDSIIRKKAIYTQIRNTYDISSAKGVLENNGYQYLNHYDALIKLDRSTDEIWSQIKRDKKRGIKKAQEMGITIIEAHNRSDVKIFYEMLNETYSNAKMPLAEISLFESVFDHLVPTGNAIFLFAVNPNGDRIATQLALVYKDTIYAWYTGAIREQLSNHPGDLLIWYLLEYGSQKGYQLFDFGGGGAADQNETLREYKSRFGTEFCELGRYEKTHSELKNKVSKIGLKVYRHLL